MNVLTTTPFGRRPVTAGLIANAERARAAASISHIDKWELFRELCAAKACFGVSDRDLTVLNALISFHPGTNLTDNDALVVFPSNRALAERAHGMAESTLRRHLAALVEAGLVARHDSPNGKRYAARDGEGQVVRAFGLDLRPLLVRADEITRASAEVRAAANRLKRLREEVILMKRDVLKLAEYGRAEGLEGDWDGIEARLFAAHKLLRRKLGMEELAALRSEMQSLLAETQSAFSKTEEMGANDADIERHYQNSKPDSSDSEPSRENGGGELGRVPIADEPLGKARQSTLPLAVVLKACPDIQEYAHSPVRHWHELIGLAAFVRAMMGISPDAWDEAQRIMGPDVAAITLAGILQRVSDIRSPGGYLRALTTKAANEGFSPGPMIMALLNV